ncbi:HesB/YadR/YfhF family protein [Sporosarcina beigongshangi]|uniref:HesB/YadR/YfhF family protein n=1 Tax=Sporosarcina beigongshangi TaxID=2782538 RepID=UPI0019392800|nr:hypothetical protein [Sporosarcina beigongshangi]
MNFSVSKEAAKWYIEELDLAQGDFVKFFIKIYGGIPTTHPNYFLGLSIGEDGDVGIKDVVEGVTFYFNSHDEWFLKDYPLKVEMGKDEPEFTSE